MHREYLYSFDGLTDKGLDQVPINGEIYIEDSDGQGTPKFIYVVNKTGVDSNTTVEEFLEYGNNGSDYCHWRHSEHEIQGIVGNLQPLLDIPLESNLSMKSGTGSVHFSRTASGTYIDKYGVLKYSEIDEPRFEKQGLLIEGQISNLVLHSGPVDNAETEWTKSGLNSTLTNNTIGPDGTTNASKITEITDTATTHRIQQSITSTINTGTYSYSLFVKAAERDWIMLRAYSVTDGSVKKAYFNVSTGALGTPTSCTSKIEALANGWYRCSITFTTSVTGLTDMQIYQYIATANGVNNYDGVNGNGLYIWGSQLELQPSVTSYKPTTTAPLARSKDICYVDGLNNIPDIKPGNFSISCEFDTAWNNTISGISRQVWDGAYTESGGIARYNMLRLEAGNLNMNYYRDGGALSYQNVPIDTRIKCVITVSEDDGTGCDTRIFINGKKWATRWDSNLQTPTGIPVTKIGIGQQGPGSGQLCGHIKHFKIFDRELTQVEASLV